MAKTEITKQMLQEDVKRLKKQVETVTEMAKEYRKDWDEMRSEKHRLNERNTALVREVGDMKRETQELRDVHARALLEIIRWHISPETAKQESGEKTMCGRDRF